MRIADILFSHAVPGAFVLDMTPESAGLSKHAALAAGLGLPHQRGPAGAPEGAPLAIVLHSLAPSGQEVSSLDLQGSEALASSVAHVVFFDRVEAALEHGLLDLATRTGYQLASTHRTEHRVYRYAAVFTRPDGESSSSHRRLVTEYRFDKLVLGELEREHAKAVRERDDLKQKAAELRTSHEDLRTKYNDLRTENQQLRTENNLLAAEARQMTRARDEANREADAQHKQVKEYENRLNTTFQALERSRKSMGFRVGLATWAATSTSSRKNPLSMPRRFMETFRGRDEVLDKLRESTKVGAAPRRESRAETSAIARSVLLLGLDPVSQSGRGVAGVVGPRFAEELSATVPFRALSPHNWRYLLEVGPPSCVLVTSDGLQAGTPWAGWGTPGGRDGAAMLRELINWCRTIRLPVVYWDTVGSRRMPGGVRFDAVFTVSRRSGAGQAAGAEILLPAVEPLMWNPIGVAQGVATNPIYVGAFDRRLSAGELATLEAVLGAAAGRGLEILDSNAGLQGPLAGTVRFPDAVSSLARRRPPAEAERAAIKRAGIVLCGNPFAGADFPSWDMLRALAMGMHVVSTPAELDDDVLRHAIEMAGNATGAAEALERLAQRPLLDATWRGAFDHVLAAYSLRDRLDQIAARSGIVTVAGTQPRVAVLARLRSEADARALREFLTGQTVAPAAVRVLVDGEIDGKALLADAIDPARVSWLRSDEVQESTALGDVDATHVLWWNQDTPLIAEAIEELTLAARFATAQVLALAAEEAASGAPLYRYGPIPADCVVAVEREAALAQLGQGTAPEEAAASLASLGNGCLIKSHPSGRSASKRSVA